MKLFINGSMKNIGIDSRILTIAVIAAVASPIAQADDVGWYFGAATGEAETNFNNIKISDELLGSGYATSNLRTDNRDNAYKIFLGYQTSPYFALEGGYFDLGTTDFSLDTLPLGVFSSETKMKGFSFDAHAIMPFSEMVSIYALFGANYIEAKNYQTGTGLVSLLDSGSTERDVNYQYGIGLRFDFTDSFALRIEAERLRANDPVGDKDYVDMALLGLVYRFAD
jgi:OmpA-OmpF porin, OOP family